MNGQQNIKNEINNYYVNQKEFKIKSVNAREYLVIHDPTFETIELMTVHGIYLKLIKIAARQQSLSQDRFTSR